MSAAIVFAPQLPWSLLGRWLSRRWSSLALALWRG